MEATAKIFRHGRSQTVRLPKEFRLPGVEAKVTRVGNAAPLEPIGERASFDAEALFARIDALRGDEPFPNAEDADLHPELDGEVRVDR